MPPTVYLVRHAAGFHDLPPQSLNRFIHDPELTPVGAEQCLDFRARFPDFASIDLVCASPLRRTLQTACLCFEPVLQGPRRVLALPDAQECTDLPSDTGHSLEWLEHNFGNEVDLAEVQKAPYWHRKVGRFAYEQKALWERAKRLRQWLRERPEATVVLVSHGVFLHYVTGNIDEDGNQTGDYWLNTQVREMKFISDSDEEGTLQETSRSVQTREQIKEQQARSRVT